MNIRTIEITNIKGISNRLFKLDLEPNRPIGFDSLKSNKIKLDDKHYFNKDIANRPILTLSLTTGKTLTADDNINTISDYFDVFVINNQTEPKATLKTFGGHSSGTASLDIIPTVLIQTIPAKINFDYNSATMKAAFGTNGSKLLNNITKLFSCGALFHRIENDVDFSRFALKNYKEIFDSAYSQINLQTGTGNAISSFSKIKKMFIFDIFIDF